MVGFSIFATAVFGAISYDLINDEFTFFSHAEIGDISWRYNGYAIYVYTYTYIYIHTLFENMGYVGIQWTILGILRSPTIMVVY